MRDGELLANPKSSTVFQAGDRVGLIGSLEESLLKCPDRADYFWPEEHRRRVCAHNYVEHIHGVAGVPFTGNRQAFYAAPDELAWAQTFRAKVPGPLLVWALGGSSDHKHWPWTPTAIVRLLTAHPEVTVALTGGPEDQMREKDVADAVQMYHGELSRLKSLVGLPIRTAMAVAQQADIVFGAETGILNAVAMLPPIRSSTVVFVNHAVLPGPVAMACQTCSGVPGTTTSISTRRFPDPSFLIAMRDPFSSCGHSAPGTTR